MDPRSCTFANSIGLPDSIPSDGSTILAQPSHGKHSTATILSTASIGPTRAWLKLFLHARAAFATFARVQSKRYSYRTSSASGQSACANSSGGSTLLQTVSRLRLELERVANKSDGSFKFRACRRVINATPTVVQILPKWVLHCSTLRLLSIADSLRP